MQLEKLQDQKPECHLEWPYSKFFGLLNMGDGGNMGESTV